MALQGAGVTHFVLSDATPVDDHGVLKIRRSQGLTSSSLVSGTTEITGETFSLQPLLSGRDRQSVGTNWVCCPTSTRVAAQNKDGRSNVLIQGVK